MSKRRGRSDEERQPEELTPEERRAQRRRERAQRRAGHPPSDHNPWRRAAVIGIPVAVLVVVVAFFLLLNVPTPCIHFVPVPASAGTPAFPSHTNPMLSTSWCPPNAAQVYGVAPTLSIDVLGNHITFPDSIGRNSSYPGNYACNLPIVTQPASQGLPPNTIDILSDWNYEYNLTTFFNIWADSYPSVYVDSTLTTQPITYTSNDLLGVTANSTVAIRLFVDNQPSGAGPLLGISTLAGTIPPYPSCLGKLYGTGHTILLTATTVTTTSTTPAVAGASDVTGPANPYADLLLWNGPLPHFGFLAPYEQTLSKVGSGSIAWLCLRAPFS